MKRLFTALLIAGCLAAMGPSPAHAAPPADSLAAIEGELAALKTEDPALSRLRDLVKRLVVLMRGSVPRAALRTAPGAPRPAVPLYGKRGLSKIHRADCRYGKTIAPEVRLVFKNCSEAAALGYTPCRLCHPDRP